jgi:hypothetical protein
MTVSPVEWYDNTFTSFTYNMSIIKHGLYEKYGQYCCRIRSIIADLLSHLWDRVNFIFIDIFIMRKPR